MSDQAFQRAKRIVHKVTEVLYEETFTVEDLDGDYEKTQSRLMMLNRSNAVTIIGEDKVKRGHNRHKYINIYAWNPDVQDRLQDYHEELDELPCSCRPHVPPETDENGLYICKHCGDKHPREVIENAL